MSSGYPDVRLARGGTREMRVVRVDGARIAGGERLLRRAARLAGFDGTVEVRGRPRVENGVDVFGEFHSPNRIVLYGAKSPDVAFHELGHFVRDRRGFDYPPTKYDDRNAVNRDPEERAANRYVLRLRKELGL